VTREEMRAYLRENPIDWPPLNPTQRLRLASLLRPDLPVGIRRTAPTSGSSPDRRSQEAA
jgi:hypothetical protein